MSIASFTAGPWRLLNNDLPDNPESWTVVGECGRHVAGFMRLVPGCQEQQKLDAQLISACPSMFAMLQDVLNRIEESEYWWMDCPDRGGFDAERIRAVLDQATGACK